MKICSDVDGVILDYAKGFIDFINRERIPYTHEPEVYGVIRNFRNNEAIRKKFNRYENSLKQIPIK